jgi:hypothetical protein
VRRARAARLGEVDRQQSPPGAPGIRTDDPVADAVGRIRTWGEGRDWLGYDPYDALNSPLAGVLSFGTLMGRRFLTQAVKLSPVNLRPLLLIRPQHNAKAIALIASSYVRLAAADSGDTGAAVQARRWLDWLLEHSDGDDTGPVWSYHFPVATRVFEYRRGTPNTIATSFAAQALLNAIELLGDERYAEPVADAARYLRTKMLTRGPEGSYFSYLEGEEELVHNANMLAATVLIRAARVLGRPALAEQAAEAIATTVSRQRPDGSWPYAVRAGHGWVDNFHTAYVLESLAECAKSLPELRAPLDRGIEYWRTQLFLADGTPKYWSDRVYPLDAHCYADAIETWVAVGELSEATRVARLLIDRMLAPEGYVYFQQWPRFRNRVPLIRWSTAPSFCALSGLLAAQNRERRRQA